MTDTTIQNPPKIKDRLIQATFIGYTGEPCTVFSVYDGAERLAVGAVKNYRKTRREGCVIISNDATIERDLFFTEDMLMDAVQAYFTLRNGVARDGMNRLVIGSANNRASPEGAVQPLELTTAGRKYQIAPEITNAQMALIATCYYAVNATAIAETVSMVDDFTKMIRGCVGVFTI